MIEAIRKALATVEEPDLKKDLISLNMIRDIQVTGKQVSFTVVLTTPACPLKELIKKRCMEAIWQQVSPDLEIVIHLTAEVSSSRNNAPILPEVRNIIAVASGKGGVGKSTVTANLAMALTRSGAKVGIIDADISGPSIPIMFGVEQERPFVEDGENGRALLQPIQQFGIKIMSMGFLAPAEQAIPWRGPMASKALQQFIGDTQWGDLDYLLIDLPPGTGDIHLSLVQNVPVTGAIIVTTPQKVAWADAQKGLMMFKQPQINVPILGIIENMSYFTPAELPQNKYYIFGKDGGRNLAQKHQVPFLGEIPLVQSIREGGDEGVPAVLKAEENTILAFEQLAQNLAQQVAIRNANTPKTEKVEITKM